MRYNAKAGQKIYRNGLMDTIARKIIEPKKEFESVYSCTVQIDPNAWDETKQQSPNVIWGIQVGDIPFFNDVSIGWKSGYFNGAPCYEIWLMTYSGGKYNEVMVTKITKDQEIDVTMFIDERSNYDKHQDIQHDWAVNVKFDVIDEGNVVFNTQRGVMFRTPEPFLIDEGGEIDIDTPIYTIEPSCGDNRMFTKSHWLEIEKI